MKLNNKGFALTSIIYMLIVLFLMILLLILANLAQRKVVLDKIKNDVKENLNQGGLLAQNSYTVTFNPTIGQINQTTKQVTYNEPYGELPIPTREGYKFIGWASKNLAPEINGSNYTVFNYENRTTTEFKNENGTNYIRINGNSSDTNIDTLWVIGSSQKIKLYQGEYILSFDIRSQNALATQSIKKIILEGSNTMGRTGIYVNQSVPYVRTNVFSNIENDYSFDNDGQWHHFTSKVTIPYDTNDALITIGNDAPNLYGPNSYIDIKNIQLEPGDTATLYEPYFGNITSDTIVTRGENHTLYAMWERYYTVTFDPNGGTLSQTSKQVTYNEPYGELPTPTREGYTFMGWKGKNLFNKDDIPTDTSLYIKGDGTTVTNSEYSIYQVNVNPNTTYTITNSGKSTAPGYVIYDSSGTRLDGANYANTATITFTTPATASYIKFSVVTKTTSTRYDKEIFQLEPGSTATTYEQYQEYTSDTMVTKREDHTLYAIWEANS